MTEMEFNEFLDAELAKGRMLIMAGRMDSDDIELQKASEFLNGHALLPKDYDKIPNHKIAEMGKLLLDNRVAYETKEAVMMILAHHGSDEALSALEKYNKNPDKGLQIFAEMAFEECKMWHD